VVKFDPESADVSPNSNREKATRIMEENKYTFRVT